MQEIKCPNCGKIFQVDASGYAQILQQVRDKEFEKEMERREKELAIKKENDLTLARMEQEKSHNAELAEKNLALAEKDKLIEQLKAQISGSETEKKLAVTEAVQEKEKESDSAISKKNEVIADRDRTIEQLKAQLSAAETEKELAVSRASSPARKRNIS